MLSESHEVPPQTSHEPVILSVLLALDGLTVVEITLPCLLLVLLLVASDPLAVLLFIISTYSCIVIIVIFKLFQFLIYRKDTRRPRCFSTARLWHDA